ncbi:MAG: helix-turn-helix domain-containing protein [Hyphomicrobiales bacterium]
MAELGSALVRAREAKGLTLEDAERDTRISRRYLQALETEQFNIIPAPVYARGFLRSYSQYLGLDPQEMLALFPREHEYPEQSSSQKASRENPIPAQSASRPSWRRASESPPPPPRRNAPARDPWAANEQRRRDDYDQYDDEDDYEPPRREPPRREPPPRERATVGQARFEAPQRPAPRRQEYVPDSGYDDHEPMIGVDIGVPAPARRIRTDPAAQTRTAVVAIVAIGAILAVLLLAFMISNAGGDSNTDGFGANGGATGTESATGTASGTTEATSTATAPAGVSRGIVPDVTGLDIEAARQMIVAAGYKVNEAHDPNPAPAGQVTGQFPLGGDALPEGQEVLLTVSDGP